VGKDGSIPAPRAQAEADLIFQGLQVCSDGLVRDAMGALAHAEVVADLRLRARRLRDTGEAFPANPYRRPNDRLECGVCCADADHLDEDEKESEKDWARDAERKYYERR